MGENYSIAEARDNLAGIVHEVEKGRPATLTRHGKPVAVLLSKEDYERLTGNGEPDLWDAIVELRTAGNFSGVDLTDEEVASWRDRSPGREAPWQY